MSGMEGIYRICESAIRCIISGDYAFLEEQNALTRVSKTDIKRVLAEYNPSEAPIMPPDGYVEKAAYIIQYRDGSGCCVDIDLWYPTGRSDLTLQLDIRKRDGKLCFIVDDLHVL